MLDTSDSDYQAAHAWVAGPGSQETLVTHSYVVVESAALVNRRLGAVATKVLFDGWLSALSVMFVDEQLHRRAVAAYTAGPSRRRSFVDSVSFEFMRSHRIDTAFTFDSDFAREGFKVVP